MNAPPFRVLGWDHVSALVLVVSLSTVAARYGSRLPETRRAVVRLLLAFLLLGYAVFAYVRLAMTPGRHWTDLLPLHICDVLVFWCLAALFFRSRLSAEIAYFWGLTAAAPAMLTPDLRSGFPACAFIHFFWGHGTLVLSLVWLAWVERLSPRTGAARRALIALVLYAVVVGAVDAVFGWNYGYLCRTPAGASLLNYLGPWPWYIASVTAIATGAFWLLSLPWRNAQVEQAG